MMTRKLINEPIRYRILQFVAHSLIWVVLSAWPTSRSLISSHLCSSVFICGQSLPPNDPQTNQRVIPRTSLYNKLKK